MLLLYMSKMVAGLIILFCTENHNFAFLLSAGLIPTSALIIYSPLTRKNIPLLDYNVCVRITDPSTKSGGRYLKEQNAGEYELRKHSFLKINK